MNRVVNQINYFGYEGSGASLEDGGDDDKNDNNN
jgi:hypothetical protein